MGIKKYQTRKGLVLIICYDVMGRLLATFHLLLQVSENAEVAE